MAETQDNQNIWTCLDFLLSFQFWTTGDPTETLGLAEKNGTLHNNNYYLGNVVTKKETF